MAHQLGGAREVDVASATADEGGAREGGACEDRAREVLVELVPRSRVELVVPTSARYVVRIEGAELEVGDDFDAETVARLVRVLRSC